jgi:hypothetical protein
VASSSKSKHQSFCELATLKGKQHVSEVHVICLNASNYAIIVLRIDSPKL